MTVARPPSPNGYGLALPVTPPLEPSAMTVRSTVAVRPDRSRALRTGTPMSRA